MPGLVNTPADFQTTLALKVAASATTATLTSATDSDGVALPTGTYGLTIDRKNSSKEYIECTLTGTALTNIKTIARGTGIGTSGFARAHRKGAEVIISDFVAIKRIQDVLESGYASATAPTTDYMLATKKYVDDIALGGATTVDKVTIAGTAGETVAPGNLLYLKVADGYWWKTDADTVATINNVQLGIAQGSGTAGNAITSGVLITGIDSNQSGGTIGAYGYVSNTAGAIGNSAGTNSMIVGQFKTATTFYFDPIFYSVPSAGEKLAMAGGSTFGTPSTTNKFITQDYNSSATGLPIVRKYETVSTEIGSSTTQFDITNPSGTTFRYTWDSTGTDPGISLANNPVGSLINFQAQNFTSANNGVFVVTGAGSNYVEVTNASGVVESNKTIGTGYVVKSGTSTWSKPSGLKYITVEMVGGGGAGAGLALDADGGRPGGSGAGYAKKIIQASSLASSEYYLIGAGGAGVSGTSGGNGKRTVFGAHCYATEGGGSTSALVGNAGTGVNGDINLVGIPGGSGSGATAVGSGHGGNSFLGGGGKGTPSDGSDSAGISATGYGGGGSGALRNGSGAAFAGGDGYKGVIILTEYYS